MQTNLKNSVYLREDREDAFGRMEEIMREDGTAAINDSAKKPAMKHHQFQRAMMKDYESNENLLNKIRETFAFMTAQTDHEVQGPQSCSVQREMIKRPCQDSFKYLMSKHSIPAKIEEPLHVKQARDRMAKQHQQRRAGKIQIFKTNLLKRINFQASEQAQSSIQTQIHQSTEAKQAKIQNFLKRQQFFAHQKQILRDMREFCTYGAIRLP